MSADICPKCREQRVRWNSCDACGWVDPDVERQDSYERGFLDGSKVGDATAVCARNENETIHKILRDERDKVRSENKRLREALEKIAKQMIGNELDEEYGSADFQYAYETLVREARAALSDGAKP